MTETSKIQVRDARHGLSYHRIYKLEMDTVGWYVLE